MVEYPSGQRALTVNQFGYAVRWFDSNFHHHFKPRSTKVKRGFVFLDFQVLIGVNHSIPPSRKL